MGKRRNRRRGGRKGYAYEEIFSFSVQAGFVTSITVNTLSNRPPRSNFRPLWIEVTGVGFVPGTTSRGVAYAPVGLQVVFQEGATGSVVDVACSDIRLCTTMPGKIRLHYPRSADWRGYNIAPTSAVAQIRAICIGTSGSTDIFLRGTARMRIALQPENVAVACPALLSQDPPDSGPSDSGGFETISIS